MDWRQIIRSRAYERERRPSPSPSKRRRVRRKKLCRTCKAEFEVTRYNKEFCSNKCRTYKAEKDKITCARCPNTFIPQSGAHKFCSRSCETRSKYAAPVKVPEMGYYEARRLRLIEIRHNRKDMKNDY